MGQLKFFIFIIFTTISCVTTSTGRKTVRFVPDGQMKAMSSEAWKEILSKSKLSKDKKLNETVRRIGKRIAKASGANFDWKFKVIKDDKTPNAFCMPGGEIAVYTGIIPAAKNEAGLAAIMGHEVAHATQRHAAERMSQAIIAQFGIVALTGLTIENEKYRPLIMASLGLGLQLGVMLPFSRKHESEADEVGLRYMAKAGYNPEEAPKLWDRMAKLGGGKTPEFLSTHPDPKRRAEALRSQIKSVQSLYDHSTKQKTIAL